ncbi:SulP family inorganic anion transporter [Nitrosococcus watsonii]|uniref:Sulphate transporter n=1 Tax=Nitrosococcus watsoni (strain C-113) TaxID=105559 RepID=D8K680_NITWC|nr:SulP family inorganic anion transporter [Nitrosococcus watsonii]ADJ28407.1 sulphate transporter [Nitrosococcus watsonii C-113]
MAQHADTLGAPKKGFAGLKENFAADLRAGLSISLIALPLSLGIALASGFPAFAGLIAAIVGGMLVSRISGSYVTINGPAAGLIVANLAAIQSLGQGDIHAGYLYAIAAVFVAGIMVFIIGAAGAGKLVDVSPSSVIHGMLTYIGVVIMAKMFFPMVGVIPEVHPILGSNVVGTIAAIPQGFTDMLPPVAIIGFVSLLIMALHPLIKIKWVQLIPSPVWVLIFAIPAGALFDLETLQQQLNRPEGKELLLALPSNPLDAIAWIGPITPDFGKILTWAFWYAALTIALITAIESGLSAKAVDQLDPYHRHSDIGKDIRAVGIGSAVSGILGGLPMIAEIVRSKANVLMGARTGWANFFHGTFILIFVFALSPVMQMIPVASLSAMMVFVGYKLAAPSEFAGIFKIGRDQFLYFILTLLVCIFTNLLVGVFAGIIFKFIYQAVVMRAPTSTLFKADLTIDHRDESVEGEGEGEGEYQIKVKKGATFTNFLSFKRRLNQLPKGKKIIVDFSDAKVVDFTTQTALQHHAKLYQETGGSIEVVGLEKLKAYSKHPQSTRYRR